MELVLGVLAASLLGSAHCAAMCGGFVCVYACDRGLRGHVAYHAGRLASYLALGATAGALGSRLDAAGRLVGVQRAATVVAGALMIAWGVARVAPGLLPGVPPTGGAGALRRALTAVVRSVARRPLVQRAAALGVVTALLPCGWLWMFVVTAGGTARAGGGALVMLAFWAGTLPALTALGVAAQRAAGPLRRRLPALTGAAMIALGVLSLVAHVRQGATSAVPSHAAHGGGRVGR